MEVNLPDGELCGHRYRSAVSNGEKPFISTGSQVFSIDFTNMEKNAKSVLFNEHFMTFFRKIFNPQPPPPPPQPSL